MNELDEDLNVNNALYEIYEEGVLNRLANRVQGAAAKAGTHLSNAKNAVVNKAANIAGGVGNVTKVATNAYKGGVTDPNTLRQPTQAEKQNPQEQQARKQIEKLVDGFINDAVKLKLLSDAYSQSLGVVIEAVLNSSLGVSIPQEYKNTIINASEKIDSAIYGINYT